MQGLTYWLLHLKIEMMKNAIVSLNVDVELLCRKFYYICAYTYINHAQLPESNISKRLIFKNISYL